jgi:vacuolar-type H+-ATPase subunit I/STV1
MIELNEIESKYLDLMDEKISIKEFENWVYNSESLEKELTEDEYTDLISLNYNNSNSKQEVGKILSERLDEGKFETVRMINLLNSIIDRDGNEGEAMTIMYDLYCKGYSFLEDLGLGIGLFIKVSNKYEVEYFHELKDFQKQELVNSVYPPAKELAEELIKWLVVRDLILTGEKEPELNKWKFIDNRIEEDQQSRIWEISDIDKKTNEIESKQNILLDKNGDFKSNNKLETSWIKRTLKKKPNR